MFRAPTHADALSAEKASLRASIAADFTPKLLAGSGCNGAVVIAESMRADNPMVLLSIIATRTNSIDKLATCVCAGGMEAVCVESDVQLRWPDHARCAQQV